MATLPRLADLDRTLELFQLHGLRVLRNGQAS
jgi:hypothetical protein